MNTSTAKWLIAIVLTALTSGGCVRIPDARTRPPPETFDETASYGWRVVWGMSQAEFGRAVETHKQEGYRLDDLEVYRDESVTRFAGIFLKDSRAWQARWRQTWREFDRDFRILRDKGYQPIDLEAVNEDGDLRFSSVWIENPGGPAWVMRWNLNYYQFTDEMADYRRKGYRMTDLEIYGFENNTRYGYVMVYDPDAEWEARWGLTVDRMDQELDDLLGRGYRIVGFEASSYPQGWLRLSVVFVRDHRWVDWTWTTSRTSGEIRLDIDRMGDRYRPAHVAIGPYEEGGLLFSWIWVENCPGSIRDRKSGTRNRGRGPAAGNRGQHRLHLEHEYLAVVLMNGVDRQKSAVRRPSRVKITTNVVRCTGCLVPEPSQFRDQTGRDADQAKSLKSSRIWIRVRRK